MIIIRISGGLGNQMFQYALGRALSLKNGGELKLDTNFYSMGIEPDRSFTLACFNIPGISDKVATAADFKTAGIPDHSKQDMLSKMKRRARRLLESMKPLRSRKMIFEPSYDFRPEILKITSDCYLSGVWQSEKYFSEYADRIKEDFRLPAPLSETSKKAAIAIFSAGGSSVSLHIRRGDMVNDPRLLAKHGDLGLDYYQHAVEYIKRSVPSPRLFIFSDDIEWCKEHIRFDGSAGSTLPTTYVSSADIPDYEELTLMSRCAHNIIAKSSFSWWGAWLNENPDKIVIAPKERFGVKDIDDKDLIPDGWVKL